MGRNSVLEGRYFLRAGCWELSPNFSRGLLKTHLLCDLWVDLTWLCLAGWTRRAVLAVSSLSQLCVWQTHGGIGLIRWAAKEIRKAPSMKVLPPGCKHWPCIQSREGSLSTSTSTAPPFSISNGPAPIARLSRRQAVQVARHPNSQAVLHPTIKFTLPQLSVDKLRNRAFLVRLGA